MDNVTKAEEFAASDKLWPDGPWFEMGYGNPQTYEGTIVGRVKVVCLSDLEKDRSNDVLIDELTADLMQRMTRTLEGAQWLK